MPDGTGSLASGLEHVAFRHRQRGKAPAQLLGSGSPRQPFFAMGIVQSGMCSCTIWAKHDIILFRVALGFLLLIVYPFVCSGRHELYTKCAAQGNALSGAIAL